MKDTSHPFHLYHFSDRSRASEASHRILQLCAVWGTVKGSWGKHAVINVDPMSMGVSGTEVSSARPWDSKVPSLNPMRHFSTSRQFLELNWNLFSKHILSFHHHKSFVQRKFQVNKSARNHDTTDWHWRILPSWKCTL